MNQKGNILITGIILGLLVIIALLWIYYFITIQHIFPKQNSKVLSNIQAPASLKPASTPSESTSSSIIDTTSWKLYTNQEFGISFKYPSSFTIIEHQDGQYYYIYFFNTLTDKKTFETCNYHPECFYSKFDILFKIIDNPEQK